MRKHAYPSSSADEHARAFTSFIEDAFAQLAVADNPRSWYNPYPFAVLEEELELARRIGAAVARGLEVIGERYIDDPRMRALMPLAPALVRILELARGVPYDVGAFRPDYLYDTDGVIRICEINARIPISGLVSAEVCVNSLHRQGYARELPILDRPALGPVHDRLRARFDDSAPVAIVRRSDEGSELFTLFSGMDVMEVKPEALSLRGGQIVAGDRPLRQFALELDRTALELIDEPILLALLRESVCFNDLRTIIIAHDKRTLALLRERSIMGDYLDAQTCAVLEAHVIPTFTLADDTFLRAVLDEPSPWILKRNSGGKGIDIELGSPDCGPRWAARLREQRDAFHVQRRIEQPAHTFLWSGGGRFEELRSLVVGTIICIDDQVPGLGYFRAAPGRPVINLAGGKAQIIPPALLSPIDVARGRY